MPFPAVTSAAAVRLSSSAYFPATEKPSMVVRWGPRQGNRSAGDNFQVIDRSTSGFQPLITFADLSSQSFDSFQKSQIWLGVAWIWCMTNLAEVTITNPRTLLHPAYGWPCPFRCLWRGQDWMHAQSISFYYSRTCWHHLICLCGQLREVLSWVFSWGKKCALPAMAKAGKSKANYAGYLNRS